MATSVFVENENGNIITNDGRYSIENIDVDGKKIPNKYKHETKVIKKEVQFSKDTKFVESSALPTHDTSLSIFEWINANIFQLKQEGEKKMFDAIKTFILPKIVQWALKAGGSIWAYIGITKENPSVEEILLGVGAFGVSAIWSLISTGKIALKNPNEFTKVK